MYGLSCSPSTSSAFGSSRPYVNNSELPLLVAPVDADHVPNCSRSLPLFLSFSLPFPFPPFDPRAPSFEKSAPATNDRAPVSFDFAFGDRGGTYERGGEWNVSAHVGSTRLGADGLALVGEVEDLDGVGEGVRAPRAVSLFTDSESVSGGAGGSCFFGSRSF